MPSALACPQRAACQFRQNRRLQGLLAPIQGYIWSIDEYSD